MATLGAGSLVAPRQGGVARHVSHDVGDLVHLTEQFSVGPVSGRHLVHDLVHVDAAGLGELAVVAVPAGVQQHLVLLTVTEELLDI